MVANLKNLVKHPNRDQQKTNKIIYKFISYQVEQSLGFDPILILI